MLYPSLLKRFFLILVICLLMAAPAWAAPMDDPFATFNVYSLGSIGSESSAYHSDFQGVAGAAGDAYFSSFSLDAVDPASDSSGDFILYTGGSASLTNGSYLKSVEIAGDAYLNQLGIYGDVISGGDVTLGSGQVYGDLIAAGTVTQSSSMTVHGEVAYGAAFESSVDYAALSDYLISTSTTIAAMTTTGTVVNNWGGLTFTGTSGINVITVDADELNNAWGFTISAPADAVVYINVVGGDDGAVSLNSTNWYCEGGITAGDVLLNYADATSLALSGGNTVNILAPFAATEFASGLVTGNLFVGDLQGGGQVNAGHFLHGGSVTEPVATPEPATLVLAALGFGGLAATRRRRATSGS